MPGGDANVQQCVRAMSMAVPGLDTRRRYIKIEGVDACGRRNGTGAAGDLGGAVEELRIEQVVGLGTHSHQAAFLFPWAASIASRRCCSVMSSRSGSLPKCLRMKESWLSVEPH